MVVFMDEETSERLLRGMFGSPHISHGRSLAIVNSNTNESLRSLSPASQAGAILCDANLQMHHPGRPALACSAV
jgi:hypothetical protein